VRADQRAAGPEAPVSRCKLPEFWPHALGIWFSRAELIFEMASVTSERQRFTFTIDALPYESLCLVADLVEASAELQSYHAL
jgi:hypothetical protein